MNVHLEGLGLLPSAWDASFCGECQQGSKALLEPLGVPALNTTVGGMYDKYLYNLP